MSLLFDFSPPCVFIKCVLRLPAWDDAKLHWLHLFTFSPLCVLYMYVIVASWLLPQDTLKLFQLFGQNPDIAILNWLLWNILQNTAGKSAAKTQTLHTSQNSYQIEDSLTSWSVTKWSTHCTMSPLSTRNCFKSSKVRPISNCWFCRLIYKKIGLNVLESKQRREKLVFVILEL